MVSGRFWAFSFDVSGFVLAAVSFTANHSKAAVCHFRVTKKRRISFFLIRMFSRIHLNLPIESANKNTQNSEMNSACFCLHFSSLKNGRKNGIIKKLDASACRVIKISLITDEANLRNRLSSDIARGIRTSDVIDSMDTGIMFLLC